MCKEARSRTLAFDFKSQVLEVPLSNLHAGGSSIHPQLKSHLQGICVILFWSWYVTSHDLYIE